METCKDEKSKVLRCCVFSQLWAFSPGSGKQKASERIDSFHIIQATNRLPAPPPTTTTTALCSSDSDEVSSKSGLLEIPEIIQQIPLYRVTRTEGLPLLWRQR